MYCQASAPAYPLSKAFFGGKLRLGCHARRVGVAFPAAGRKFADDERLVRVKAVFGGELCRGIDERGNSVRLVVGIVVRLQEVERSVRFAARRDESGIVPVLLVLDVYAAGGNEKVRIYRVNRRGDLVREFLDFGECHFLGCPAAAFGCHALRFVEDFPRHERVVVSDRLDDRYERVVDERRGPFVVKELPVRFDVELVVRVDAPLVRFHQVVAEEAHRYHDAVFFGDVESLFHVGDGACLETRDEMRRFVDGRALAHVVE